MSVFESLDQQTQHIRSAQAPDWSDTLNETWGPAAYPCADSTGDDNPANIGGTQQPGASQIEQMMQEAVQRGLLDQSALENVTALEPELQHVFLSHLLQPPQRNSFQAALDHGLIDSTAWQNIRAMNRQQQRFVSTFLSHALQAPGIVSQASIDRFLSLDETAQRNIYMWLTGDSDHMTRNLELINAVLRVPIRENTDLEHLILGFGGPAGTLSLQQLRLLETMPARVVSLLADNLARLGRDHVNSLLDRYGHSPERLEQALLMLRHHNFVDDAQLMRDQFLNAPANVQNAVENMIDGQRLLTPHARYALFAAVMTGRVTQQQLLDLFSGRKPIAEIERAANALLPPGYNFTFNAMMSLRNDAIWTHLMESPLVPRH